jgi:methionine-gamma-lyase
LPTKRSNYGFSTRAIHYGYEPSDFHGALSPPVYLTATYAQESAEAARRRFGGESDGGHTYGRVGNPTTEILESRLASLEEGEAALATASGMGAISACLWSLVEPGSEIVTDLTLYGCTFAFFTQGLARFGVTIKHVDLTDLGAVSRAVSSNTTVVFFETPANPNMRLIDIHAVSAIAKRSGALVVVDNTYATPVLQRPLTLGADLVVHSATKYLGGHGDLLAGAIVGSAELIQKIRFFGLKDLTGAVISPMAAFLILRGLRTLELRMERHCRNAKAVVGLLAAESAVKSVYFPGLPSHPQYGLALRQMSDYGGIVAFELKGGMQAGLRFMDNVELCARAVSLGDTETLVQHPASMTHAAYPPESLERHAISDGLIRISVGLETVDDLLTDISQALRKAEKGWEREGERGRVANAERAAAFGGSGT